MSPLCAGGCGRIRAVPAGYAQRCPLAGVVRRRLRLAPRVRLDPSFAKFPDELLRPLGDLMDDSAQAVVRIRPFTKDFGFQLLAARHERRVRTLTTQYGNDPTSCRSDLELAKVPGGRGI